MDQPDRNDERGDAVSALFALLTAKLEDAAALAADGQGRRSSSDLGELAGRIHDLASECTTITAAVKTLLDQACSA